MTAVAATQMIQTQQSFKTSLLRMMVVVIWWPLVLSASAHADEAQKGLPIEPAVTYKIVQHGQTDPAWKISIIGTGFTGVAKPLRLRMETWGGWLDVDDYYLRGLTSRPPIKRDPGRRGAFVLEAPTAWDGAFEVSYTIPLSRVGSAVQQRLGLLPCWNEYGACGFSVNTLMHVDAGDRKVHGTAHIVPPEGMSVASGWGGLSQGEQQSTITGPTGRMDNTPILIGKPTGWRREKRGELVYEVAQFGAGDDQSAAVMQVAQSVIPLYELYSGHAHGCPVRFYLFEGTPGANGLRSACVASYRAAEKGLTPQFRHVIAHELFHGWLGSDFIQADEAVAWFHEGFTDYLSLWHCAASGVIDRGWFATRLIAIDAEARRSPAYGKVAFAAKGIDWRSSANEKLAYRGGAVLAFLIDVELRKQGRPGLMQMIADLGARNLKGPISLGEIRAWMQGHGLESIYKTVVEGKELPPMANTLASLGFSLKDAPVELTYFGIRAEQGRITELDPKGPAAQAGFRVGDRIIGRFPERGERVRISAQVTTPYRYGLENVEPGVSGTFLDVQRGKEELTIPVQPRIIQGGLGSRYVADEAQLREFFVFRPARR
jgi:hypothetical protein